MLSSNPSSSCFSCRLCTVGLPVIQSVWYPCSVHLLLDTNIIIPLEPASASDLEAASPNAMRLFQLAQEVGAGLFIHPQQSRDIANDTDESRRKLRGILLQKYRALLNPPPLTDRVRDAANHPEVDSHTWIDAHLVAALDASAVDYLISEDRGLHRVCRKLGLEDRCLSLLAALDLLAGERTVVPQSPPAVESVHAYELNSHDPIFSDVRADYLGFDAWLDKCKRQHRQAWTVRLRGMQEYAGIAIVNPENREWPDSRNPTLKICTFKISDHATGAKLGELLLRAIFEYAHANNFETLFIETLPKQGALLHLLHQFGFEKADEKPETEEWVLRKRMRPITAEDERLLPLEYAKKFGPFSVKWSEVAAYVIPIEPRFHALLFPELEPQGSLLAGSESFGNTLIKAYLCRAQTRRMQRGDIVFFYRSGDWQAITTVGVVEETLPSDDESKMTNFLKKRTVYRPQDIAAKCREGGAFALTFRHAPILKKHISLPELITNHIIAAPPQSITKLTSDALKWLRTHL